MWAVLFQKKETQTQNLQKNITYFSYGFNVNMCICGKKYIQGLRIQLWNNLIRFLKVKRSRLHNCIHTQTRTTSSNIYRFAWLYGFLTLLPTIVNFLQSCFERQLPMNQDNGSFLNEQYALYKSKSNVYRNDLVLWCMYIKRSVRVLYLRSLSTSV